MPPYVDVTHQKAADEFAKLGKWTAIWDTLLKPGEALFFPPSMLHETRSMPGEACSVAASLQVHSALLRFAVVIHYFGALQIRYPFAGVFIRDFGERLVNSNEVRFDFLLCLHTFLRF